MFDELINALPLLAPIVLIDLGFRVFAIIDLMNEDRRVKGNNKMVWIFVIALISYFGWIAYFLVGRDD